MQDILGKVMATIFWKTEQVGVGAILQNVLTQMAIRLWIKVVVMLLQTHTQTAFETNIWRWG